MWRGAIIEKTAGQSAIESDRLLSLDNLQVGDIFPCIGRD